MFDVTNKNSFDEVVDLIGEVKKMKETGPHYHCILVGYVYIPTYYIISYNILLVVLRDLIAILTILCA